MGKVAGIAIPLSMLVGLCEEFAFRGFLPLILAAKTGLPTAAIVAVSATIFGVSLFFCCLDVILPQATISQLANPIP